MEMMFNKLLDLVFSAKCEETRVLSFALYMAQNVDLVLFYVHLVTQVMT